MIQDVPMLAILSWFLLLGAQTLVKGEPYEAYPMNEQYPPVARVNEAFSFQISNDTFKSTVDQGSQILYSASNLPQWLSFDSSSRTFTGTPDSSVLNDDDTTLFFSITLEGTDPVDNESFSTSYQLAVSAHSSIEIADNFNLLALLKNYGSTNGKDALILTPNEIFNVTFDRSTFSSEQPIVAYYGQSLENNAPLPSWLWFDPNNLKFSGTAPVVNSDIAPQMSYGFVLTATDIEGFSGVSVPFHLVVGAHELTTTIQNSMIINVTDSGDFSYELPLNYVFLDESPIQSNNLGALQLVDAPYWVGLNNDTLTGTLPADHDLSTNSTRFSVAVHDIYDDVIYLNFMIESTDDLFAVSTLSNVNATRGEWFQYNFLPSQFTDYSQTTVAVNYTNSTQSHEWISFVSSNMTLHGQVPDDFDYLNMNLIASRGSQTQALDFEVIGMDSRLNRTNHTSSITSSSSSSTRTSSISSATSSGSTTITAISSTSAVSTPLAKNNSKKSTAIACGVAIPLGLIALIAILLFVFWRRRKNRKESPDNEKGPNISGPDTNNPANRPNQHTMAPLDPFRDDQPSATSSVRRMAALNAMKLDESLSSDSDTSTMDEKGISVGSDDVGPDARSTDNLLKPDTEFFDPQNRSSSVYIDSEPANRKSWRYRLSSPVLGRDSCISTSTVSTADLMNTVIKDGENINKDPRKSTLGMRDSVFMNDKSKSHSSNSVATRSPVKFTSGNDALPILDEHSNTSSNYKSATSPTSSSSDDFVPVKDGSNYNWIHRDKPDRRPSNKRLVKTENQSDVDVGQAAEIEGHFPEKI